MDDLKAVEDLEAIASTMLRDLSPAGQRSVMRRVARDLRKSQSDRIKSQKNPDGSAFEARRKKREPSMGNYTVRFLYPEHGIGPARAVLMKSWRRDGPLLTGYDVEAGGIRSFFWDKVIRWLGVSPEDQNKGGGKIRNRPALRDRDMFRKIRSSRYLRSGANEREAWIGFIGGISRIAKVHQEGLKDEPASGQKAVTYAVRELLGMTLAEREDVLDIVFKHLLR
ncbi:phage virion morphogenesis protein [Asticcacaulis endophyticus]|uniref:Tail protein n=1 Tax=Asticcacaulis endophyticus TaxID=1395890 RepID=A0A918Q4T4_9CAUL|nr:phage virion morphogenesis protein [Asticcacaulis endophyticus]GGZ32079.1 tail protein [Asticcacaulis endophyticus]